MAWFASRLSAAMAAAGEWGHELGLGYARRLLESARLLG
jgi:hypothetical protein